MERHAQRGSKKEIVPLGHEYRTFVAAILARAVDDLASESLLERAGAWTWINSMHPWFVRYCWLLELDPELVRLALTRQYGSTGRIRSRAPKPKGSGGR